MSDVEKYKIDRYNVLDYLKHTNKTFAPIPDHIRQKIIDQTRNSKQSALVHLAVYTILYADQNEFNTCKLPVREKYKKFFDATENVITPVLNRLEELGFIVQQKEKRKKVIFVKYPEYINNVKSITFTEKTTVTTTTERSIKLDLKDGSQEQFEQTMTDEYLDSYIEWTNNNPNCKNITNPTGFKRAVRQNPDKFDFNDYEVYRKKQAKRLEKAKEAEIIAEQKREQAKRIDKEREERFKVLAFIEELKNNNPDEYTELYTKAYNKAKSKHPDLDEDLLKRNVRSIYLIKLAKELMGK